MRSRRQIHLLSRVGAILVAAALAAGCGSHGRQAGTAEQHQPALPGPAAVSGRLVVGLSEGAAGWGGSSTAPELDQMVSSTGARWFRDQFLWSTIEPRPGKFSFAYYDHYMLLVGERGLHVVPQLLGAPSWAAPTPTSVPANPDAFAGFVAAVVRRYGPGGSFWRSHPKLASSAVTTFEVWNEPYFSSGNGGVYDPGRYARLIEAASIAGHAVAPSTRFLLEAEMETHLDRVWTWWVGALYHAVPDLNRYFDGVAAHDFGTDVKDLSPIVPGKPYPNFGRILRLDDLRRQFLAHGAGRKPFWIMESGSATCTLHVTDCVTPAEGAANMRTFFHYVQTDWKTWVQAVFVYRYRDGSDPNTVQGGYGLIRDNGEPKPALAVFKPFAAASAR
ncbi:MAG TPA: beta-galactosidase [Solirubrobacteraceae bacterium]|nr:beta-galactosidase [Solirubrobacteraceae bacterium]